MIARAAVRCGFRPATSTAAVEVDDALDIAEKIEV